MNTINCEEPVITFRSLKVQPAAVRVVKIYCWGEIERKKERDGLGWDGMGWSYKIINPDVLVITFYGIVFDSH